MIELDDLASRLSRPRRVRISFSEPLPKNLEEEEARQKATSPYSSLSLEGPARKDDVELESADWVVERRRVRRKESICSLGLDSEDRRENEDGENEVFDPGDRDVRRPRVF